jgi:phospholipid transport system substrate-binding protein
MRRLTTLAFAALAILTLATNVAGAATDTPQATIRDFYASLLQTMKRGAALGERGRYDALAPAIRQSFDLRTMAQMSVGLSWARFSPDEQQLVTDAFARYTIATYADRFNGYSGQKFEVIGQRSTPYGTIVESRLVRSSGEPVSIDYLMRQNGEHWQIADVYLTGAISQVATLRSQFSAVLGQSGVKGLVDTLNRKADMLVASNAS